MRYKGTAIAVVMLAAMFSTTADAQLAQATPAHFQNCDGFGGVTRVGDGMSQEATGFWVAGGDRVRRLPSFRGGVAACDAALQALEAFPQSWMRRVSLLQARALHRLVENDAAGALADVDLADQAAADPQDPFYLRSLGVNTNLIRALALVQSGDHPAGEALALATWASRPYSREVIGAVSGIVGPDGSQENLDTLLRAAGQMDPSNSDFAFRYKFETGRFEAALAHFGEIVAPVPIHDQSYDLRTNLQRVEQQRARDTLFWLSLAGHKAYALAALGRAEEARATLAEAHTRLEASTPALPPLPARPSNRDRILNVVREQANLEIQTAAPEIRDSWAGMVEARIAAHEGRLEEARTAFEAMTVVPPSYAYIDLLGALGADLASIEAARRTLPQSRLGLPERNARTLFSLLLDAETRDRAASRMGAIDAAFTSRAYRERGGCEERRPDDGTVNICYKGFDATLAVTEERALLRAAARAAENGGRFRIERRSDIRHSIVSTMYGVPMNETQAGFESSLYLRFFAEGESCARCLTATDVQTALSSIYAEAIAQR